jgi:hypothetical protein
MATWQEDKRHPRNSVGSEHERAAEREHQHRGVHRLPHESVRPRRHEAVVDHDPVGAGLAAHHPDAPQHPGQPKRQQPSTDGPLRGAHRPAHQGHDLGRHARSRRFNCRRSPPDDRGVHGQQGSLIDEDLDAESAPRRLGVGRHYVSSALYLPD